MRAFRPSTVFTAAIAMLALTGCTPTTPPENPNYVIDLSGELWHKSLSLQPEETVLIKNATGELDVMIAGTNPNVYIHGDLPADARVYVAGVNADVTVSGDIDADATIIIEGDGGTLTTYDDIDEKSTIQFAGKGTTLVQEGFFANLFGDASKYIDTQV